MSTASPIAVVPQQNRLKYETVHRLLIVLVFFYLLTQGVLYNCSFARKQPCVVIILDRTN